ncbi:MAG: MATE family efflux transporter [Lachnospiraceae bacterium]|nr:MATE family efflux transporter [Lachnospiraceae bacterium]
MFNFLKRKKQNSFIISRFNSMLIAALIECSVSVIMGVADNIVSGNVISQTALSGLTLVAPFLTISLYVSTIVAPGIGVQYAELTGQMETEKANRVFSQGLIVSVFNGAVMFLLLTLFGNAYLTMMAPSAAVFEQAAAYLVYFRYMALLFPIACYISHVVYWDGDEKLFLVASTARIICALGLSVLLAFKIGIAGLGIGSSIGLLVQILIDSLHFFRKVNTYRFRFALSLKVMLKTLKISLPDCVEYGVWAILSFTMSLLILTHANSDYLPLVTVILSVMQMYMLFGGIGSVLLPMVAVYRGEGNIDGERRIMYHALRVAFWLGLMMTVIFFIFPQIVTVAYGIHEPAIAQVVLRVIRIVAVTFLTSAVGMTLSSYFLYTDRVGINLLSTLMQQLLGPIIGMIALTSIFNILGPALGVLFGNVLGFAAFLLLMGLIKGFRTLPLLIKEPSPKMVHFFEFEVTPAGIRDMMTKAEALLQENGAAKRTIFKTKLFIEEIMTVVMNRNASSEKMVLAECTLKLGDDLTIILRDDGEIFNVLAEDGTVDSLSSFILNGLMTKQQEKMNALNFACNRNVIRLPLQEG